MISIIIPNLHSPLIDQVVHALDQQTARYEVAEIIVVGQDRYNLIPPHVHAITTPQPVSAAAARNRGAAAATSNYLLFLDSDCIAAPDLVEQLLACHRRGFAVVGGSVVLEPGNYWVGCDNVLAFGPFLAVAAAGERPYLPSLNFSIQRDLFTQIGGFDERFAGAAGEDLDLSLRLRMQGYQLYFEPRAQIAHRPQRTSATKVWAHLHTFGRVHGRLQERYNGQAAPHLNARMGRWAGMVLGAAPLLALGDVMRFYMRTPTIRAYWRLLPGMIWGKTAWYWGVAESLMISAPQRRADARRRAEMHRSY